MIDGDQGHYPFRGRLGDWSHALVVGRLVLPAHNAEHLADYQLLASLDIGRSL